MTSMLVLVLALVALAAAAVVAVRARRAAYRAPTYPPPVDKVTITVDYSAPDQVAIAVDPWVAAIKKGAGTKLKWTLVDRPQGPNPGPPTRYRIRPKNPADWPFRPPLPAQHAAADIDIEAGRDLNPGDRYPYAIEIRRGSLSIDLDPDIIISDLWP